jgi:acyl-CoA dehydrogenase
VTADDDLLALVDDFFGRESGAGVTAAAEESGLPGDLWRAAADVGLTRIGLPEDLGGAGGTLVDAVAVLVGSGRHAVPLPLLESWLAGRLRTGAGETISDRPATVTLGRADDTLTVADGRADGVLTRVPWGRAAAEVVVVLPGEPDGPAALAVLEPADAEPGRDLAGMPCDTLAFTAAPVRVLPSPDSRDRVAALAALGRAAQLAGAIAAAAALTSAYVEQRHQFGRPIGRFQAVQQHVVTLAQAAATALHVVERAAAAAEAGDGRFAALAAKLVVSENATDAIRAAHQAHGAIGMTREYRLQQFTRRLMAWRADLGAEGELAERLGATAAAADSLAHLITAPDPRLEALPR